DCHLECASGKCPCISPSRPEEGIEESNFPANLISVSIVGNIKEAVGPTEIAERDSWQITHLAVCFAEYFAQCWISDVSYSRIGIPKAGKQIEGEWPCFGVRDYVDEITRTVCRGECPRFSINDSVRERRDEAEMIGLSWS